MREKGEMGQRGLAQKGRDGKEKLVHKNDKDGSIMQASSLIIE